MIHYNLCEILVYLYSRKYSIYTHIISHVIYYNILNNYLYYLKVILHEDVYQSSIFD